MPFLPHSWRSPSLEYLLSCFPFPSAFITNPDLTVLSMLKYLFAMGKKDHPSVPSSSYFFLSLLLLTIKILTFFSTFAASAS
jgi:hypothetical protein